MRQHPGGRGRGHRRARHIRSGGIAGDRGAIERHRETGGRGAAVTIAHRVAEGVLQVAAGRRRCDRRRLVGDIGIRTVRIQRQVAVGTGERGAHDARPRWSYRSPPSPSELSPSASVACANTPEAAVAVTVEPAASVAVELLATGARSSVTVRVAVAVPPLPSLTV